MLAFWGALADGPRLAPLAGALFAATQLNAVSSVFVNNTAVESGAPTLNPKPTCGALHWPPTGRRQRRPCASARRCGMPARASDCARALVCNLRFQG